MHACLRLRVVCLLLLLGAGPVWAEPLSRDEEVAGAADCGALEPGSEVSHRVEARVEGDLVHLQVTRTFHNPKPSYIELGELLPLPPGGTVHGLALESQGQWTEGLLLEAEEAEQRYQGLRARGRAAPRPVALLSVVGSETAWLRLWNVPPRASVTVRYAVRTRLGYGEGRRSFEYPRPTCEREVQPVLTVAPPFPGARVRVQRRSDSLGASWEPKPFTGIEARSGQLAVGASRLEFVQLRAAPRLSEVPAHARVVFVVDASYSMGVTGLLRQLAFAESYLQLLPDASAEVVVFRRSAERLFGRFVRASDWKGALAEVPAARLAPGNGSHLDEGVRVAQQVLEEGRGPARVLVLTDGQLRDAYAPVEATPGTLAPEAAVHLVRLPHASGWAPMRRQAELSPVRDSCGVVFTPPSTGPLGAEALEALVRPVLLEQVRLVDERGALVHALKDLKEGEGLQALLHSTEAPPSRLVLQGQRWRCLYSQPVVADAALSADLGRNAWSFDDALPEDVLQQLAAQGAWVSHARSLLAAPAGVGPSTVETVALEEGLEGVVVGGVVGGLIGCPLASTTSQAERVPKEAELVRLLQPGLSACVREGNGQGLRITVESTGTEIVDVTVTGAVSPEQESCAREAAWGLRLGELFDDGKHVRHEMKPFGSPVPGAQRTE
jgi:hypothetical protein